MEDGRKNVRAGGWDREQWSTVFSASGPDTAVTLQFCAAVITTQGLHKTGPVNILLLSGEGLIGFHSSLSIYKQLKIASGEGLISPSPLSEDI